MRLIPLFIAILPAILGEARQPRQRSIKISGSASNDIACTYDQHKCVQRSTMSMRADEKGCVDQKLLLHLATDLSPEHGNTTCHIHGCITTDADVAIEFGFFDGANYLYPCGDNYGIIAECKNPNPTCEPRAPASLPQGHFKDTPPTSYRTMRIGSILCDD